MIRLTMSVPMALGFALAAALAPSSAGAQDATGPSCSIEEGTPKEVAQAYLRLNAAASQTSRDAKLKALKEAVKQASTNYDRGQNIHGRNYIMAKAYAMMLQDSLLPVMTTRGELGLVGGAPADRVDLIVAVDSLLDTVEQAQPDCVAEAEMYRQNQVWLNMLNAAIALVESNPDSAQKLAERTLILHDRNPYGYQVLASVAARKGETPRQIELWKKVIETSANDTSAREVHTQANYYLGNIYAEQAQAADSGAEKVRLAREAAKLYQGFLQAMGDTATPDMALVRSNLGVVYTMSGDTLEIPKLYAPLLAAPDKYSAADYLAAGDMAARLNRGADAVRLYESVIKQNPRERKALYNLAASYYSEKQYAKMIPTVQDLLKIDPSNKENWELLGYAYAMLLQDEKDPARKKTLTDSLVKYQKVTDEMTTSVEVADFAVQGNKAILQGTITNTDPKATKNYTLKVEFLDKAGAVVATKEETVSGVAPNTAKEFKVEVEQAGVTAFRYAPIK